MEESDEFLMAIPGGMDGEASRVDDDLTHFAIAYLLKSLDPEKKGYITRTRLNKASYLINKRLRENHGLDVGIPWFWYRHGPMLGITCNELVELDLAEIRKESTGIRIFYASEPDIFNVPNIKKAAIAFEVEKVKYQRTPALIDQAYKDRPFLNNFRAFERFATETIDLNNILFSPSLIIKEDIDRLLRQYPEDELRDSLKLFLRFESIIRVLSDIPSVFRDNVAKVVKMRGVVSINASFVYLEHMNEEWIGHEMGVFQDESERFADELYELEGAVFTKHYSKPSGDKQPSDLLREISLEMAREE